MVRRRSRNESHEFGGNRSGVIAGEWGQLALQVIDIFVVMAWVLPTVFALFWVLKKTMGLRVSEKEETEGLDIPEHGIEAYPEEA